MSMIDLSRYLPVRDVAKLLRRTPRTIHRYVARGYLKGEWIVGRIMIERGQLDGFVYPEPGNPLLKRRKQ